MATLYKSDGSRSEPHPKDPNKGFTLEELQALVGGYIELITLGFEEDGSRLALFVDEEGKLKGKPINHFATALWHSRFGVFTQDCLVGDCLLVTIHDEGDDDRERTI